MKCLYLILILYALVWSACSNEQTQDKSSKSATNVEKERFVGALTKGYQFKDPGTPESLYKLISPRINNYYDSKKKLSDSVKRESGDLFEKMKELNVSDDTANTVLGALKGDGSDYWNSREAQDYVLKTFQLGVAEISKSEGMSDYNAKKILYPAVTKTWPDLRLRFEPLPVLSTVSFTPELPAEDPEYVALIEKSAFYWDPKYMELLNTTSDHLPKGAIVPLVKLIPKPIPQGDLRDGAPRPTEILRRYGEEACDPVTHYLLNPSQYGSSGSAGRPPYSELAILAKCPEEKRREIIRASLESGWMNVGQYIPANEEWADALYDQFEDSPYGVPGRYPEYRLPTEEERRVLNEKLEEFKKLYDEKITNSENPNRYGIMMDLEKQFKFESKKLALEFSKLINQYRESKTL